MSKNFSFCLKAVETLDDQDLGTLTDHIEAYTRNGLSAEQAETAAIADLLASIDVERGEVVDLAKKQHPKLFTETAVARAAREAAEAGPLPSLDLADDATETPEFKRWFGNSQVTDFHGDPLVVYHGTTSDFSVFSRERAHIEADMGAGFYFSNEPDDVANNYAGEGPDLTLKIEQRAEQIEQDDEFDGSHDDAVELARKEFSEHAGATMPVYLSIENPVVIGGGRDETDFTFEQPYDEETDEFGEETGTLVDLMMALQGLESQFYDMDYGKIAESLQEATENGSIGAADLITTLKASEGLMYATTADGKLASTEIIRQAFEEAGFDGIIDNTVDDKFGTGVQQRIRGGKSMVGMNPDTVHYIAFFPEQIKSAIGNRGTFDKENPDISMSLDDDLSNLAAKLKAMQPKVEAGKADSAKRIDDMIQKQRELEGMRAAIKDPQTGKVWTGWSHQAAINSVPTTDETGAWGRLSSEWDQSTDNTGFLDKDGNFISRTEAEKRWGVLTMEDIRDARQKPRYDFSGALPVAEATEIEPADDQDVQATHLMQRVFNIRAPKAFKNLRLTAMPRPAKPSGDAWGPQEQRFAASELMEKVYGKRVIYYSANMPFAHGIADSRVPDAVFISEASKRPVLAVAGHEMLHKLRMDNPALYDKFSARMAELLREPGRYRDAINARYRSKDIPVLSDDKALEELLADIVGDFHTEPRFWRDMAHQQGRGFRRILELVKQFFDDLIARLRSEKPYGTEQYLADIEAARDAVVQVMSEYAANGGTGPAIDADTAAMSVSNDPFYSELQHHIGRTVMNSGNAGSWKQLLKSLHTKGVKADEIAWTGIEEWLDMHPSKATHEIAPAAMSSRDKAKSGFGIFLKGDPDAEALGGVYATREEAEEELARGSKITRDQVLRYLQNNGVQVTETVLGKPLDKSSLTQRQAAALAYSNAVDAAMEAGEPVNPEWIVNQPVESLTPLQQNILDTWIEVNKNPEEDSYYETPPPTKYHGYALPGGERYREVLLTLPPKEPSFELDDYIGELADKYGWKVDGQVRTPAWTTDMLTKSELLKLNKLSEAHQRERTEKPQQYNSPHWDDPNVIAHIRLNDRTDADGKKVLFVEEIQSDWAQQGKKRGFASRRVTAEELLAAERAVNAAWAEQDALKKEGRATTAVRRELRERWEAAMETAEKLAADPSSDAYLDALATANKLEDQREKAVAEAREFSDRNQAAQEKYDTAMAHLKELERQRNQEGIPRGPFVEKTDAWVGLAIKRVIKMAADEGYDRVAFINGDQSADRYDLSRQISGIVVTKMDQDHYRLVARDKRGATVVDSYFPADNLEDMLGKEVAARAIAAADAKAEESDATELPEGFRISMDRHADPENPYTVIPPGQQHGRPYAGRHANEKAALDAALLKHNGENVDRSARLSGLDLTIGGEGMKAFYNQIVPKVAKDVLRKIGGQPGQVGIKSKVTEYARTRAYVGPSYTTDQVRELYQTAQRGGQDVYMNPLTGNKEMFPINTVTNADQIETVLSRSERGVPFEEAVVHHDVSEYVATLFGGRIENRVQEDETLNQFGFDITPAMREKAAGGLPMFSLGDDRPQVLKDALAKAGIDTRSRTRRIGDKIRAIYPQAQSALRSSWARGFQQGALDQFTGIKQVERSLAGELMPDESPYVAARLANGGTSSVMRGLLLHGQARWAKNEQHLERVPDSEGLLDILAPLGSDLNEFFGWMIGNRAARLKKEGRERNLSDEEIAALQGLNKGREAAFRTAAMKYTAFKRSVLDLAQHAGLINPETRPLWDQADYIPFYRQVDDKAVFSPTGRKGLAGQSSGIRSLKGGDAVLNDPMENIIMNFSRLVDASLKNNALRKTIKLIENAESDIVERVGYDMTAQVIPADQIRKKLLEAGTPDMIIDTIPKEAFDGMAKMFAIQAPSDADVVRVMIDGKPRFYRVNDPLLLKALTSFVPFDFPGLGVLRAFKRVLTAAITATPEFMARNWVRDSMSSQMISKTGFNPAKSITGMWKSYAESGGFEPMLFAGASFQSGQITGADPTATSRAARRALRKRGMNAASANKLLATVADTPAKFWEKYRHIGEAIENANREAVYESTLKATDSPTAAAFESKDLMDFTLRGSSPIYQFLADVLPFFNARVQGLYRLGRANPKRLVAYGMLMMVASIALEMINEDNPEYQELPDWEKDAYWHIWIKGRHVRVPKPFELGVIFASIPSRVYRYAKGYDSGKKFASRLVSLVHEQLAFDPVPQAMRPAINAWANRDTFRDRSIEGQADEGKLPSQRFSGSTSPTARELVNALNVGGTDGSGMMDQLGLSPKKVEYLVGGYLGTTGLYALGMADMAVDAAMGAAPKPAPRLDDYPLVRAFYRESPARATVYESELYDLRDKANKVYKSMNALDKSGRPDLAEQMREDNGALLQARKTIDRQTKQLSDLNKARDQIIRSRELTPKQKRAELDKLQVQKNALTRATMTNQQIRALQ